MSACPLVNIPPSKSTRHQAKKCIAHTQQILAADYGRVMFTRYASVQLGSALLLPQLLSSASQHDGSQLGRRCTRKLFGRSRSGQAPSVYHPSKFYCLYLTVSGALSSGPGHAVPASSWAAVSALPWIPEPCHMGKQFYCSPSDIVHCKSGLLAIHRKLPSSILFGDRAS